MENGSKIKQTITYYLVGFFILCIIGCIIYLASANLNEKESGLLSILLTIISIVATWVVSNIFADVTHKNAISEVKEQHLTNLKTYALNAAEKVDNLSNELSRLSTYLLNELEKEDDDTSELSKMERLESAIHIVNTLKSVNDTSLSDWKGVIGDELDEIREEKLERENELRDLIEKGENVINLQNHQINNLQHRQKSEQTQQIDALRKELTFALNSISGSIIKPKRMKSSREKVESVCPNCNEPLNYTQKAKQNSFKTIKCLKCENRLISSWNPDTGFQAVNVELKDEVIKCPFCEHEDTFQLSNLPFSKSIVECKTCKEQFKLTRKVNCIDINKITLPPEPKVEMEDEELIKTVKDKLTPQPWPTGIHKQIAEELGLAHHRVAYAIKCLISKGDFLPQVDGILYYKKEDLN